MGAAFSVIEFSYFNSGEGLYEVFFFILNYYTMLKAKYSSSYQQQDTYE